ncbi:MAG: NADH-quinone oxidoreductase subunit C, partial [Planctomycetia bacterium]
MNIDQIHSLLLERFKETVVGTEPKRAMDPWIQVDQGSLVAVCRFLHDDSRLLFDHLNDLCGVDYL